MNKDETQHAQLVDEVGIELDELRRAGDQLDEAVALQFGLNRTDLRCLGILYRRGRVTAGELAEESGLTPGAITTVLDRLERGGTPTGSPTRGTGAACSSSPRSRRGRSAPESRARSSSRRGNSSKAARRRSSL